jgi:hypothetical protein
MSRRETCTTLPKDKLEGNHEQALVGSIPCLCCRAVCRPAARFCRPYLPQAICIDESVEGAAPTIPGFTSTVTPILQTNVEEGWHITVTATAAGAAVVSGASLHAFGLTEPGSGSLSDALVNPNASPPFTRLATTSSRA